MRYVGFMAANCRSYHCHMPMYEFHVEAQAQYEPEQSMPQQGLFRFAYTITVTNTGEGAAQLIARCLIDKAPKAPASGVNR